MAIRDIVKIGQPVLRQRAAKVNRFGSGLKTLIDDMVETMRAAPGIGLAAPQIGVPERVIVVEIPEDEKIPGSGKLYTLINPEIVKASRDEVLGEEGCLSIPNLVGDVWRAQWLTVKGLDVEGKEIRIKATDWLARAFQHEIDHLNGRLFVDMATEIRRLVRTEDGIVAVPLNGSATPTPTSTTPVVHEHTLTLG